MDPQAERDRAEYRKDNKKGANNNFDEINAYMRQQRHEAAENKRRLEEAERGSAAKEALGQDGRNTGRLKHHYEKKINGERKS